MKEVNEVGVAIFLHTPCRDDPLITLAKAHLQAKLDCDSTQIIETKIQLVNYLDSEYKKLDKKYSKHKMLKRIRISLIKNPYDQIGRKMATEAKDIFKESTVPTLFEPRVLFFKIVFWVGLNLNLTNI